MGGKTEISCQYKSNKVEFTLSPHSCSFCCTFELGTKHTQNQTTDHF